MSGTKGKSQEQASTIRLPVLFSKKYNRQANISHTA
jgi:hypothetical protein